MNIDELNNTIAEFLGWKAIYYAGQEWGYLGTSPEGYEEMPVPNYYRNLNAMREAELWMFDNKGVHYSKGYYEQHLPNTVGGAEDCWSIVSASSEQRAIAFLKTIGKYVE